MRIFKSINLFHTLPIFAILILSTIFRFYNFQNLQFWSADEETAAAVVYRMIAQKTISLISFNANLGVSVGSFFHVLSVPVFLITFQNPVLILLITSGLGIITTLLLYWAGKLIGGHRLGLISAFLYSSSFLISIFDRRWWTLTPNPLLATIAVISLVKIVNYKRSIFLIPLVASIGFAFHSDPSLAVIAVASLFTFLYFKPKFSKEALSLGFLTLLVFVAPLAIFEFRHPGTIINPLLKSVSKGGTVNLTNINFSPLVVPVKTVGMILAPTPTKYLENQFDFSKTLEKPFLSPLPEIVGGIFIIYPLYLILERKVSKIDQKQAIIILNLFFISFIVGTAIWRFLYHKGIEQHYFTVMFPVAILLVSYSLSKLTENKKLLMAAILLTFLFLNIRVLLNSSFQYPLARKVMLVKELSAEIGSSDFSLYVLEGGWLGVGGWTELFIFDNKHPKKSYIYPYYDFIYRAHSLYTVTPTTVDQEKIVIIGSSVDLQYDKSKEIARKREGNIEGVVFDNSSGWFDEKTIVDYLNK